MAFSFGPTSFTPEEAQAIASDLITHFRKGKATVEVEESLRADAPYRTTLVVRGVSVALIEAQHAPSFGGSLRDLARWLASEREDCELYVATHEDSELSGALLNDLARDGVGLIVVGRDGDVAIHKTARNPALTITPAKVALGPMRGEVNGLITKFNGGERKDALREMYELVEGKTDAVIRKAARAGYLIVNEASVMAMDWSSQTNTLASPQQYVAGKQPLVSTDLRNDLQSFRGARNLIDHKVRSKAEGAKRERQYPERMMAGPRLLADLLAIERKIQ
jgi:hypothetical protein